MTDPVPGNDSATNNSGAGPQADLTITKTGTPNPYVPGALLTYTIVVSNAGPSNVSNARVQDALPAPLAGFTWTCTASGAGAACGTAAGSGSIDALVTLPAGTHATFTVSGTVPTGTTAALVNTATVTPPAGVSDPVLGNNSATSTLGTTVADVAIAKSGPASVGSNGAPSYTLVVTNHGPAAANGAVVTDPAVANFNATTVSCGTAIGGAVCPASPTVPQLQAGLAIPVLPSGGSVTLTVSGTAAVSGTIANVATVAPPAGVTDPTPGNNSSTANTSIVTLVDLTISKTGSPNPYVPGALLTYTIVVTNAGPGDATNAQVQDALPAPLGGLHLDLHGERCGRGVRDGGGEREHRCAGDAAGGHPRDVHGERDGAGEHDRGPGQHGNSDAAAGGDRSGAGQQQRERHRPGWGAGGPDDQQGE